MSAETVAAIGALVDEHRELLPILKEHLEDMEGEVLPHLVLADVIRWMVAHERVRPDSCRSILDWMERRAHDPAQDVRNLVLVSGVDLIPNPGQPGSGLRDLLGPTLRSFDPWL